MSKPKQSRLAFLMERVRSQREWILRCGGDLAGYIANYGDPGVRNSKGQHMFGDGGTLIYQADKQALDRWENELAGTRTSYGGDERRQAEALLREVWYKSQAYRQGEEDAHRIIHLPTEVERMEARKWVGSYPAGSQELTDWNSGYNAAWQKHFNS
jgi:hypothetical protein